MVLCYTYPPTKHKHLFVLNINCSVQERHEYIYRQFLTQWDASSPLFFLPWDLILSVKFSILLYHLLRELQNSFSCWFTAVSSGRSASGERARSKRFVPLGSSVQYWSKSREAFSLSKNFLIELQSRRLWNNFLNSLRRWYKIHVIAE